MTISYTGDICSSRSWSFLKVIFRWRGSIWKSVLVELIVWLVLYYAVTFVYKFVLDDNQRKLFTVIAEYTNHTVDYIPLTFMLGFFVKIVVDRWKDIFENIGFVDTVAHSVAASVRGSDPETIIVRRNIMRYLCLVQVLVLRDISLKVRKRYPNMQSVVDSGFLMPHEQAQLEGFSDRFGLYWLPLNWVCQLCARMRATGAIDSDPVLAFLLKEIMNYRERLQTLCIYDWVPVPLAYPQVVFVAVRTYFMICLISRQTHPQFSVEFAEWPILEMLYPAMTVLQLVFYMGWVKVAEALLNPLGEDDDDFETIFVIERNLNIAMQLADECWDAVPEQRRDALTALQIRRLACNSNSRSASEIATRTNADANDISVMEKCSRKSQDGDSERQDEEKAYLGRSFCCCPVGRRPSDNSKYNNARREKSVTPVVSEGRALIGSAASVMPSPPNSRRGVWRRASALFAALQQQSREAKTDGSNIATTGKRRRQTMGDAVDF